jgi:hypothetical protein
MRGFVFSGLPKRLRRGINGVPSALLGGAASVTAGCAQLQAMAGRTEQSKYRRIERNIM